MVHLHFQYSYQAKYLVFLIMLHPDQLLRKILNVYNTDRYGAAQRFGWIRTRNHDIWVLNPTLLLIFLGPITAYASDHPHVSITVTLTVSMGWCPLSHYLEQKMSHLELTELKQFMTSVLQLFWAWAIVCFHMGVVKNTWRSSPGRSKDSKVVPCNDVGVLFCKV